MLLLYDIIDTMLLISTNELKFQAFSSGKLTKTKFGTILKSLKLNPKVLSKACTQTRKFQRLLQRYKD